MEEEYQLPELDELLAQGGGDELPELDTLLGQQKKSPGTSASSLSQDAQSAEASTSTSLPSRPTPLTGETFDEANQMVMEGGRPVEKERNAFKSLMESAWNTAYYDVPAAISAAGSALMPRDQIAFAPNMLAAIEMEKQAKKTFGDDYRIDLEEAAKEARKEMLTWALERSQRGAMESEDLIKSFDDVHDAVDLLNFAATSVGQSLVQIPTTLATGGASSVGQAIGGIYMDEVQQIAQKEGITPQEVIEQGLDDRATAIAFGAASGFIDKIGADKVMGGVTKKFFGKSLRNRALQVLSRGGGAMLSEGATEATQSVIEQAGADIGSGQAVTIDVSQLRDEALAGALGGGGVTTVGAAINAITNRKSEKAKEGEVEPEVAAEVMAKTGKYEIDEKAAVKKAVEDPDGFDEQMARLVEQDRVKPNEAKKIVDAAKETKKQMDATEEVTDGNRDEVAPLLYERNKLEKEAKDDNVVPVVAQRKKERIKQIDEEIASILYGQKREGQEGTETTAETQRQQVNEEAQQTTQESEAQGTPQTEAPGQTETQETGRVTEQTQEQQSEVSPQLEPAKSIKEGDRVQYEGQQYEVQKKNPDGSFDLRKPENPAEGARGVFPREMEGKVMQTPTIEQTTEQSVPPPAEPPGGITEASQGALSGSEAVSKRIPRIRATEALKPAVEALAGEGKGTYSQTSLKKVDKVADDYIKSKTSANFAQGVDEIIQEVGNIPVSELDRPTAAVIARTLDKVIFRAVAKGDMDTATRAEKVQEQFVGAGGTALVATRNDGSPESEFLATVSRMRRRTEEVMESVTEDGTTVREQLDSFAEEVKKEFGLTPEDAKKVIERALTKAAKQKAFSEKAKEGKKELNDALARLRKSTRKTTNVGIPITAEMGKALVDAFKAIAKIAKYNMKSAEARFKREVAEFIDPDKAWKYLQDSHSDMVQTYSDISDKIQDAVLGFYSADEAAVDLAQHIANESGLTQAEADALAQAVKNEMRDYVEAQRKTRLRQIAKKYAKTTKQARKIEDRLVESIVLGGLNDASIKSALEEKFGLRSITPAEVAEFQKIVEEMNVLPGDKLKRERMIEVMDKIKTNIEGEDRFQIATALWFAAVLSSPRTQVANFAGNLATSIGILYRIPQRGGVTGIKTMISAYGFVTNEITAIMKQGRSYRNMDKLVPTSTIERISRRPTGLGFPKDLTTYAARGGRYVGRVMNAVDAFFFFTHTNFKRGQLAYRRAQDEGLSGSALEKRVNEILSLGKEERKKLENEARNELQESAKKLGKPFKEVFSEDDVRVRMREITEERLGELSPDIQEQADEYATKFTLQNRARGIMGLMANLLGGIGHYVENPADVDSKAKKAGASVAKFYSSVVFPFMNTAANMTNLAIDYVPVAGAAYKGLEAMVPMGKLSSDTFDGPDAKMVFAAKQVVGTLMAVLLLEKIADEEDEFDITANGPSSYEERNQLRSMGWEPYSIQIGGKRVKYRDWPAAGFLTAVGAIGDLGKYEDEKKQDQTFVYLWGAMSGYFTNSSMLKSISDFSGAIESGDPSKALRIITRPIGGFTRPAIVRDIENLISPEYRDKNTFKDIPVIGGLLGELASSTTIAGPMLLDVKYNALGQPIKSKMHPVYRGLGIDRAVTYDVDIDPVFEAMLEKGLFFSGVGRSNIHGVEPTNEEYSKYALAIGRFRHAKMTANLERVKEMDADGLQKYISRNIDSKARNFAEDLVYDNQDNLDNLTPEKIDKIIKDKYSF